MLPLQPQISNGTLAERLGNGLQNRVEQFDSARYLTMKEGIANKVYPLFCLSHDLIYNMKFSRILIFT